MQTPIQPDPDYLYTLYEDETEEQQEESEFDDESN
jgi:hypothetical protein